MGETRLEMFQRLLTEAEEDLATMIAAGNKYDQTCIDATKKEISGYKAKIAKLS